MSTFAEIKAAADSLSDKEKEDLLHFLAVKLGKGRALPKADLPPKERDALSPEQET